MQLRKRLNFVSHATSDVRHPDHCPAWEFKKQNEQIKITDKQNHHATTSRPIFGQCKTRALVLTHTGPVCVLWQQLCTEAFISSGHVHVATSLLLPVFVSMFVTPIRYHAPLHEGTVR
eukprot:4469914-Amphidinium_carterae.1